MLQEILIKSKRILQFGLGVAVTVGCLTAALWGADFENIRDSFKQADYRSLPLLLLFLFLYFWLKAIRWRLLLEPMQKLTTAQVTPAMMIGFMGNNLLPAHLGEFVRVFVLGKQFPIKKTAIFSTVLLERLFDVIVILGLLAGSLLSVSGLPDQYRTASIYAAIGTGVVVLVLGCYIVWTSWFVRVAEAILDRLKFIPEKLRHQIAEMMETGAEGLASMRHPRLALGIAVTSIFQWVLMGGMVFVALWSFDIDVPYSAAFVVVGITAMGVTVPSTPGFFGVIQLCFKISLAPFDVNESRAFAASIYYHISQYIPITLVGLFFLNRLGLRLGDMQKEAEHEAEEIVDHAHSDATLSEADRESPT